MNPRDRLLAAGRRMTDPAEAIAQQVTERVVDLLVNALDLNEIVARIDLNALLGRVDVDAVLEKVDVDALLDQVDVNALLDHVNVNALLDRVDVDALLARVGVNALLDRVDVKSLLDRVDLNDLLQQIDMDSLVERTDLGAVIARSSGGMTTEAIIFVAWEFLYFGYCWAVSGRTPGMALLGIRVVRDDGTVLPPKQAIVRALVFPLSFLLFGLGFLGILVQHEHRALHDLIAGSAVVYSWDARAAHLRFLASQAEVPAPGSSLPAGARPDPAS